MKRNPSGFQKLTHLATALAVFASQVALAAPPAGRDDGRGPRHEFDPGPDLSTAVGRKYAEIFANTPDYLRVGARYLGGGKPKFRWQFGPMPYRGRTTENGVKVLVIGQEGAQDENISDRAFTGGTGGRMQNALAALGIDRSYLFINTFLYTINGQYADYAPMLENGRLVWKNLLSKGMLDMAQDPQARSEIVRRRHELIDHVLESNRDSLKLIIAVGGAAEDTLATYILSRGGECGVKVRNPDKIQLVRYGSAPAGGNRRFFFPVDERGRNLLLQEGERNPDYSDANVQNEHKRRAANPQVMNRLVKLNTGALGNGLDDVRQLTTAVESCRTPTGDQNTLKGLRGIDRDIRFISVMHPGSNSPSLLKNFTDALAKVGGWQGRDGWRLPADPGMEQPFERGFRYGHKAVPRRDFRFGLPDVIGLGTTSSTRRDGGMAIEFGSRDKGSYTMPKRDAYLPTAAYRQADLAYEPDWMTYDSGPTEEWARLFAAVPPSVFDINTAADRKFGAGAVYRGRPDSSEVVVLADQTSHDDMWVGRALMGLEGQKLQAFLGGIGAGLSYTILRTLPVDTLGAGDNVVDQLVDATDEWRKAIWARLMERNKNRLKLILTLGRVADKVVRDLPNPNGVAVVSLTEGYDRAFNQIRGVRAWNKPGMKLETAPVPIARQDIPYAMRRWTGTSGDRVVRANGNQSGKLYKIFAPSWVRDSSSIGGGNEDEGDDEGDSGDE